MACWRRSTHVEIELPNCVISSSLRSLIAAIEYIVRNEFEPCGVKHDD